MENIKKFNDKIKRDNTLTSKSLVFSKSVQNEDVLSQLYNLCRETFLIQYNAEISKDPTGVFKCFIPNESFEMLGAKIKSFFYTIDVPLTYKNLDELIEIFKNYYRTTATSEELASKGHLEKGNNNSPGLAVISTYYNFTDIDWDMFETGIKESVVFE